ncbi:MAG: hypothetical protein EOP48_22805 [Sphingobacteriales bacterium]|nr:MAG: hypothetical protein EOP48_22805 [Sphingobacteriales bacterium]
MKKTNYTLIITLVAFGLIAVGVYSRVKSSKTENSSKTEKEVPGTPISTTTIHSSDNLPSDSFIARPHEIAGLINKDLNQIAEFFHEKGNVDRDDNISLDGYTNSTYKPYGHYTAERLYVEPKDSVVMRYTFRNKDQFTLFFEEVAKMASETLTIGTEDGVYPAYIVRDCMFVKNGFSMSGDVYKGTMYSVSRLKALRSKVPKRPKPLVDSSSNNEDQTLDQ